MKKFRRTWRERIEALFLAVALTATGILPGAGISARAAGLQDFTIIVSDANTHDGIAGVTLTFIGGEGGTPVSDKGNGEYSVQLDPDGTYSYTAQKGGYVESSGSNYVPGSSENLTIQMTVEKPIIAESDANIKVNENCSFTVSNSYSGFNYQWESNDTNVAQIDSENGMVTGKSKGSAEITVSCNGVKSDPKKVTVDKASSKTTLEGSSNGGTDIDELVLTAKVTPIDATGTFEFFENEVSLGSVNVNNGQGQYYYKKPIGDNLKFKVKYSGDDTKYEPSEAEFTPGKFQRNQKIIFSDGNGELSPHIITIKEGEEPTFSVPINQDASFLNPNGTLTYSVTKGDGDVLTVDTSSGKVTVKGAGEATIEVSAAAEGNYLGAKATYYVYVQSPLKLSDIVGSLELDSKLAEEGVTYSGNKEVDVTGTVDQSVLLSKGIYTGDLQEGSKVTFTIKAELPSKDVDEYRNITVKEVTDIVATSSNSGAPISIKDRIELVVDENQAIERSSVIVKVNPRKVVLGTKDTDHDNTVTVTYTENVKEKVESTSGLLLDVSEGDQQGIVGNEVDLSNADIFYATVTGDKYDVGDHSGEIRPYIAQNASEIYPNYEFESTPDTSKLATLKIEPYTPQIQDILENVVFSSTVPDQFYQDGGKLWIGGGMLKGTVKAEGKFAGYYDTVLWRPQEDSEAGTVNLTAMGYDVDEKDTGSVSGYLILRKGVDSTNDSKLVAFTFYVDKTAPQFYFGEWGETKRIADEWAGVITFGQYKKAQSSYSIDDVKAEDNYTETSALSGGVEQSGVKEWGYYIWKVDPNQDITPEAVKEKIKNVTWIPGAGATSIPVATVEGDINDETALEKVQGEYVVLVQVSDHVGNSIVCTPDGLIIDVKNPTVTITADGQTSIDPEKYNKDDVDFQVSFHDVDTTSGFAEATITVKDGEEIVSSDLVELKDGNTVIANGEKIAFKAGEKEKGPYTLTEIQSLASKTVTGTIHKAADSNNLKIVVEAKDQAGNPKQVEQPLRIDSTQPEISVAYTSEASVKNGKYFNKERVMTITYKEKNFDPAGVTFEYATGTAIENAKTNPNPVTLSDLEKDGIGYKWGTDSEEQGNVNTYTNNRTNQLILTFSEDKEYYIVPHCTDLAGNEESKITYDTDNEYEKQFVIDKTPPVITVVYSDPQADVTDKASQKCYTQDTVTATITITETNFWLDGKVFSEDPQQMDFEKTTGTEAPEGITDYQTQVTQSGDQTVWSQVTNSFSTVLTFEKDANYALGFTYTDLAGNATPYEQRYFTVDKTQPEGTISVDEKSVWAAAWEVLTFNIFKNSTYDITLTSTDATAGVTSTAYCKLPQALSQSEVKDIENLDWTEGLSFKVSPNEQFVVYARIIDKAGNIRYLYPNKGAVADDAKPDVRITNLSGAQNGIHRGDVTLRINATDPTAGNTYSGLEKVWYTVNSTGNQVNSTTVTLLDNSANRVQGNKDFTQDIVVPANQFNSNDVKVQAFATDFSGNTYESEILPLKIDITAPTIQVSYDLNSPANGKYYNQTRTATVTVTERNFDENAVRFNITNTDGTQPAISGWSRSADAGVMDSATNTCTVSFAADGDYTFTLNCTDLAGNDSSYTQTDEFTIDKTVPTIEVSFDNNSVSNGRYYNAPRTATITVNEHNFNGTEVQTSISASLQSQGISAPGVNGWSTSGDRHSATASFSQDGDYSFNVNYTDLAGNAAQVYNVDLFTIDQTKPEVEIFDIEDRSANSGEVAPGVRYSDINYNANDVEISISGPNHQGMTLEGEHSAIPNGESIKMADFAHEEAVDDVYTLKAQVTDLAGNMEEDTVVFSVNRFGSNYVFSDATRDFLRDGLKDGEIRYANEEKTLVVTEINVDTIVNNGVTYGRDGDLVSLKEGEDYTVKASGSEESWKRYEYTIPAKNFEEEGRYDVTIESEDRAANKVNNKIKGADIEFVIDKTSPTLVITGLENDAQYRENSRDVTVSVMDNAAMGEVDIYMNDETKPIRHYEAEAIAKQDGEILYTMDSSNDWQRIRASAVDAAGNKAESEQYRVLLTSNLLVQYYRNTPLFVGSLVVVLAAVGGFILLLVKRRKKEEENA